MNQLLLIRDEDVGLVEDKQAIFRERTATRAIAFRHDSKIPLLHVTKHGYYKLPGGGVDPGETLIEALRREMQEEAGVQIEIGEAIGTIEEWRSHHELHQFSHCFLAKVTKVGENAFTEFEKERGFKLEWHTLDQALFLVENSTPTISEGKFIVKRDLTFLKKAKEIT